MKIFKKVPQFEIMGKKYFAFAVSAILIIAGFTGFFVKGINYGIDFRGGTIIQVKFQDTPPLKEIRQLFVEKLKTNANVTTFGEDQDNELLISLSQDAVENTENDTSSLINEIFKGRLTGYDIRRVETVGPKVGGELREKAVMAALYALAGILIYIGIRFKPRFGVGAVVALFHDVFITMGIFVLLDKEFTLTIVAAILTIIGYSLNDTIVVFDRIRENLARMPKSPMERIINQSINESMSRTILTSVTTFIVVLSLYVLGGNIIRDFSFAILIGLVVGTYSSIFVASPVVMYFESDRMRLFKSIKSK
ncbi:MAG: protein translocase subunit SecF [Deltaproteobacteria bacterium]|nr:protein translocase subunit SecF [Deltaproteobacteria bacterium]